MKIIYLLFIFDISKCVTLDNEDGRILGNQSTSFSANSKSNKPVVRRKRRKRIHSLSSKLKLRIIVRIIHIIQIIKI